jgi:hypothetical protein
MNPCDSRKVKNVRGLDDDDDKGLDDEDRLSHFADGEKFRRTSDVIRYIGDKSTWAGNVLDGISLYQRIKEEHIITARYIESISSKRDDTIANRQPTLREKAVYLGPTVKKKKKKQVKKQVKKRGKQWGKRKTCTLTRDMKRKMAANRSSICLLDQDPCYEKYDSRRDDPYDEFETCDCGSFYCGTRCVIYDNDDYDDEACDNCGDFYCEERCILSDYRDEYDFYNESSDEE